MAYDSNEKGVLFVNDKKQKDTDPDFKGDALIQGQGFWVAGWKNVSKSDKKYIALKFTKKDVNKAAEKKQYATKTEEVNW